MTNHSQRFIASVSKFPLSFYDVKDDQGNVIGKDGISLYIFEWIAKRFSLDSQLLEITDPKYIPMNPNSTLPYLADDLRGGVFDLMMGLFVMTPKRNQYVNFPHSFFSDPLIIVVPSPELAVDVLSVWKIFSIEVWFGIVLSALLVAGAFRALELCFKTSGNLVVNNMTFRSSFLYMTEVLFSQGGHCNSRSFSVKALATTWCLAAFVIVNSYNCKLIAHLFATDPQPIVRSVQHLINQTDVKLVVKKGSGVDFLLSTTDKGIYKQLGDMLNHPESRCPAIKDCLRLVRTGSYAYLDTEFTALDGMLSEYKLTKKCEFVFIRESQLGISMAFATAKNSSVTEIVNRGILAMRAHGLTNNWIANHRPITRRECPRADFERFSAKNKLDNDSLVSLELKHLAATFVVLAIGSGFSLGVFLVELMASRTSKWISR